MDAPRYYQIRVRGHLGPDLAQWFEGFSCAAMGGGESVLTGRVQDQAALYGVLAKIARLNLGLVAVNPIPPPGAPDR